jgi:hypothetical protein
MLLVLRGREQSSFGLMTIPAPPEDVAELCSRVLHPENPGWNQKSWSFAWVVAPPPIPFHQGRADPP